MTKTLLRAGALSCALLASSALTAPAMAQTAREHRQIDANGVDLTHGDFIAAPIPEGAIGAGEATLPLVRNGVWDPSSATNGHQWDRITYQEMPAGGAGRNVAVTIGNRAEYFPFGGGTSPTTGSSLTGSANSYVYRTADGATIAFSDGGQGGVGVDSNLCTGEAGQGSCILVPISMSEPDGKTVTIAWDFWPECSGLIENEMSCTFTPRIAGVGNSFGYSIQFAYSADGGGSLSPAWHRRTGATFHNVAVSGNPAQGSVSYSYPSAGVTEVTDMGGHVWRLTGNVLGITAIRRPGASSDTTTITGPPYAVTSVTRDGVTTNYARTDDGGIATMAITDAQNQVTTVVSDLGVGRPTSITDPLSRTTAYQYDGNGRLTRVTAPEGNEVQYSYDARGNVTETRAVAKSGSALPDMVATASYDATCANPLTCNQPNAVTDARGNVTDYTYDATHGRVLTVTAPAPSGGAARRQTRYSYSLISGEYRLTGVSACAAGAAPACLDTANETRTILAYDAHGNVTSVEQRDGTGALSATQAMTYDALGNLLTVDGPLSGSADTIRFRYNAARQIVGAIGPDPDQASGALRHRADRTTYTDGRPTRVERGTVDSQSDGDWAAFASLEEAQQDYDAYGRPVVQRLVSGSTTHALSQTSYDALGRVRCTARRMNPAEFASLPSDACTLDTQGSFGPDRIVRATYDNAGRTTRIETGYGVSGIAADEVTTTYRANGQVETVTDANGNRTSYVYDGHDRLSRTNMPDPSTPGTSSSTDYEALTYETLAGGTRASPLVVSRRLRDNESIGYSYDNLGRLTAKTLPATAWFNIGRAYTYDNFGRLLTANGTGEIAFAYDGLGRLTSETSGFGATAYLYDLAGRRTRLTYTDGFYVTYDHLVTGEVTAIRENGAGALGTYVYDDLGRRTSLTRGNGTVTSYVYDDVSRLSSLTQDLGGSTNDVTFGYAYNPAGEIAANTRSDDAYSFTLANINVASTADGLNRITAIAGSGTDHDARGNVVWVPATGSTTGTARGFAYTSDNALAIAANATSYNEMYYDSVDRLLRYHDGGAYRFFLYDGQSLVAETNAAATAIARRYVHGPGTDEPLVWYEGAGTSTRRWFHADERGSVIAVSDASGDVVSAVNRYDDYGAPQGALTGRFGYTGQPWFAEIGLYHYRARAYNPALGGRFMQTDPIGYNGGMNLYAYVGNNPVNRTDPLGLQECDDGMFFDADPRARALCESDVLVTGRRSPWSSVSSAPTLEEGGMGNGDGTEGGEDSSREPPLCLATPPQIRRSAETTTRAVNTALREIYRGSSGRPIASSLSSEFSRINSLPDFSRNGWTRVSSIHAQSAWEAGIPSVPGMVVKIYINDSHADGMNTATLTSATNSVVHYLEAPLFVIGVDVNASRAQAYLRHREICQ